MYHTPQYTLQKHHESFIATHKGRQFYMHKTERRESWNMNDWEAYIRLLTCTVRDLEHLKKKKFNNQKHENMFLTVIGA